MDGLNNTLKSFAKFKAIFGDAIYEDSCKKMVEQIIFWCTVYGDSKHFLKEQLLEKYGEVLTGAQIKRILGIKFRDWGNLSKKFLELQGCSKETGEVNSLIRMLWETNDNLMELLAQDSYTFKEELENMQESTYKVLTELQPEDLDHMYFSAPVQEDWLIKRYIRLVRQKNVHIDNECDSLLEKISNYIKTLHRICHISVFIFVNLKTYLSEDELKELYISCFYEKINLILFENQIKKCLEYEKMYILDKEYCIIESN